MKNDPIVEEVRKVRIAFATRHGNNLDAMCDALLRRKSLTAPYVTFAPKRIEERRSRRAESDRIDT
jgi:hypothetical protein